MLLLFSIPCGAIGQKYYTIDTDIEDLKIVYFHSSYDSIPNFRCAIQPFSPSFKEVYGKVNLQLDIAKRFELDYKHYFRYEDFNNHDIRFVAKFDFVHYDNTDMKRTALKSERTGSQTYNSYTTSLPWSVRRALGIDFGVFHSNLGQRFQFTDPNSKDFIAINSSNIKGVTGGLVFTSRRSQIIQSKALKNSGYKYFKVYANISMSTSSNYDVYLRKANETSSILIYTNGEENFPNESYDYKISDISFQKYFFRLGLISEISILNSGLGATWGFELGGVSYNYIDFWNQLIFRKPDPFFTFSLGFLIGNRAWKGNYI